MAKKTLKTPETTVEYENPHESNTLYKDPHVMALGSSSLRIHGESYTRG
jgi:hypothetical protein